MSTLCFCLGKNKDLALKIAGVVEEENLIEFDDGEVWVEYVGDAKGKDIVCVQILQGETNKCLTTLLMFLEALKCKGASKITLVFPYFFYGRQDREFSDGVGSIASRWLAKSLENVGVNKLIVLDLHAPAIIDFFSSVEVVNLKAMDCFLPHLQMQKGDVVVSPDKGGVARAKDYANALGAEMAIVNKQRTKSGLILELVQGDVAGKRCFIVDDILGTGGTLFGISKLLKNKGAKYVTLVVTHAVFCGDAVNNLRTLMKEGIIDRVLVSNSIPRELGNLVEVVDISKSLANAI